MERTEKRGYFVVSLDFELFWGMFDKVTLAEYGDHVAGERTAIPKMLSMFTEYGIHATWATVGMLMARSRDELNSLLPPPNLQPTYEDMGVSAYTYLTRARIGGDEHSDVYHYGSSLVQKICATPFQEIGNHTFSHFYCIDGHENPPEIFDADLEAYETIAKTYGITAKTIVFPRNQMSADALHACAKKGIRAYRGNENHVLYRPRRDVAQSPIIRAFRLLDHYINISGHHTYPLPRPNPGIPLNVPSSRFLRPWSSALRVFESLRIHRIKQSMTHAAKHGEVFHLWWHPHNFGINQEQNFKNLQTILGHFSMLKETYGMESASMEEIATLSTSSNQPS